MERSICIHGHFYQPPRENPWSGEVEEEPSARPFHDWNERIAAECYQPMAETGLYERMSFNFGPTLLNWMRRRSPDLYAAVLEADRRFGSAIAQAYNHIILPLAPRCDRITQVVWGIRDFEHRFGRFPEGMWLPETAVDTETLEILAEQGIRFTILAPHQARRARPIGSEHWHDAGHERIDATRPYRVNLPSGRTIALFFYHAALSRAVAFEGILKSGRLFGERLAGAFSRDGHRAPLIHIATDGETYGHHHRGGVEALADCFRFLESQKGIRITHYADYLNRHPPEWQVEILEKSSWSCSHGIDRWWSDCGCTAGGEEGWRQEWRTPLRNALDWLRDRMIPLYEAKAAEIFNDPWQARDRSIQFWLDGSDRFFEENARRSLNEQERRTARQLLELQRNALFMYTSCGWFFNDLARIETMQVLRYAGRAIELAESLFDQPLEEGFLKILEQARSNVAEQGNGRQVYLRACGDRISR